MILVVYHCYHRPVSEGWQPDEYPNDLKSLVAPMRGATCFNQKTVECKHKRMGMSTAIHGIALSLRGGFHPEAGDICGNHVMVTSESPSR